MSKPMTSGSRDAKFTYGSTMRHVLVMTSTGSVGLIAIFLVDFANLFYIAQLGIEELAAAIGYAGTIMFFNSAIGIGLSIAASASVSRRIGQGDVRSAHRLVTMSLIISTIISLLVVAGSMPFLDDLAMLLGATGQTLDYTIHFLYIVVPSMPFLVGAMVLSALLRSVGDARGAMFVTLSSGLVAAILDPILIFVFDLGLTGAAIASVISRVFMVGVGFYILILKHNMIGKPELPKIASDTIDLFKVATPAMLTNIATPAGNAWIISEMAQFGDGAVAGFAIVGRIIPVAFGALFALSGAVGPIIGQNFGALEFDRLSKVVKDALLLIVIYTLSAWGLLFILQGPLVQFFNAEGDSASLVFFFCTFAAAGFLFNAALFVTNAVFNNLGFPFYSMLFNWGRATLGTIPFTIVGAYFYQANGVLAGQAIGGVVFAFTAQYVCWRMIARMRRDKLEAA
ncbi:Multidrug export protein MepA [Pseudovibrio axinellae]|uniref:Multidrug-efflux transporter n=1 Tax=Pseudovibrio axinellae TaxID=989403 RepID=A0A165YDJ9_9HYPH|nr:MATE family efflux transporter [Pseudovibrio axinellae]KZL18746.1 Multidrug export protein MepA [Pseudovibrio axinellae]SEP94348.1 putative efflux protein, MATE family [Pseudovibrio axinellae]